VKLYGADDYVEQHHIKDMLPPKLEKLLGLFDGRTVEGRGEQNKPHESVSIPTAIADGPDAERVRATAHSIVADIALYHSAELEVVLSGGGAEGLVGALAEGTRILEGLIPRTVWPSTDPVRDAFVSFIDEMRRGGSHFR
jgi:hypothetical protein